MAVQDIEALFGELRSLLHEDSVPDKHTLVELLKTGRALDEKIYMETWVPYLRGFTLPSFELNSHKEFCDVCMLLPQTIDFFPWEVVECHRLPEPDEDFEAVFEASYTPPRWSEELMVEIRAASRYMMSTGTEDDFEDSLDVYEDDYGDFEAPYRTLEDYDDRWALHPLTMGAIGILDGSLYVNVINTPEHGRLMSMTVPYEGCVIKAGAPWMGYHDGSYFQLSETEPLVPGLPMVMYYLCADNAPTTFESYARFISGNS